MAAHSNSNRYQVFKGSSDSITLGTAVWRYMTFEKFFYLIETSKLHHARLDQLGDPFEGSVTSAYAHAREIEVNPAQISSNRFEPWIHKSLLFRTYATCWHASPDESDAQWKLYASGGAGVAIVSSLARLSEAVDIRPYRHGILGPVEYIDFENHDMRLRPFGTRIRPGFAKRKSFEHEKEVRGVILLDPVNHGQTLEVNEASLQRLRDERPVGILVRVNLKVLIQSIVISPLARPYVEELVRVITKRSSLYKLVRKSGLIGVPRY